MVIRAFLLVAFALSWGMDLAAEAATLPFADKSLQPKTEVNPVSQPEPSDLSTHWWGYFTTKGEELKDRINETLRRLNELVAELPEDIATSARPTLELIRANLKALPQAKAQPDPEPPPPPPYLETYTLSEWLDITSRRRKNQASLEAEREEAAAMAKAIRAANRRLDTLVAAYLGLSSSDPTRVLRGLEIMAERSAIAVAEERLRVARATILAGEVLLEHLGDQQNVAAKRLSADPDSLEPLREKIKKAKADLEKAQKRVTNAQASVLTVVGDDPEDKATALYRQQRALAEAVEEGIAQIQLIKLEAEFNLVTLLLAEKSVDFETMHKRVSEWTNQLKEIRQRAAVWRLSSERERDRAGELVAGGSRDANTTTRTLTFIGQSNQNRLDLAQETLVNLQRLVNEAAETELLIELLDTQILIKEGRLWAWLAWGQQGLKNLWEKATGSITTSLFKIGDTPVTTLGLLRVVLIVTIAWWISYWLRHALMRLGERGEGANLSAFYTVARLSHYVIIAIGFMVGLSSIGADFTTFALFAGAMAIGIGFGLQSIVNNFVSGLILLFDRSLKVGDFVELASGVAGEVREIKVRSTVINTNDNVDIVVPNSEFMNTQVTNWTLLEAYCRIHVPFKVAYGTDKEVVRKAGLEAAEKLPHTLLGVPGRNPGVWLVEFGESGLDFELVVWVTPRAVKRPGAVHAAYMWEIESALSRHGVEIPLPQRDLRFRESPKAVEQLPTERAGRFAPQLTKS